MTSISLTAQLESLHALLEHIRACSEKFGFNSQSIHQIILASEEVLVNIISYSYPDQSGQVEVTCLKAGNKPGITILFKDQGTPFNPLENAPIKQKAGPPVPSLDNSKAGGFGIYIYTKIMDQVEYKRLDNSNILSLTKYMSGAM